MSDDSLIARPRWPLISLLVAGDGLLLLAAGVVLTRLGAVSGLVGLALAVLAVLPAGAAVLIGLAALRHGPDRRLARIGVTIGALQTVATGSMGISALAAPDINDITTDLVDPPAIVLEDGSRPAYPPAFADIQREVYPEVTAGWTTASPETVHRAAREVAEEAGWTLVPVGPGDAFRATVTTGVFRFVDDVVVRITREADRTRIDVRSRSRVGRSDLGTNAQRIQDFLTDLDRRLAG